ncbi:hypothetical protein DFH06DRAFT_1176593 [Mycena polygramma]|nr:hypothetical protein DFH06DRAFT_1176593 [Mycena polygramma]
MPGAWSGRCPHRPPRRGGRPPRRRRTSPRRRRRPGPRTANRQRPRRARARRRPPPARERSPGCFFRRLGTGRGGQRPERGRPPRSAATLAGHPPAARGHRRHLAGTNRRCSLLGRTGRAPRARRHGRRRLRHGGGPVHGRRKKWSRSPPQS